MAKTLNGIVTSTKMQNIVVVEVTRKVAHPKYKKLLKRSKKFKAAVLSHTVSEGDRVSITENRPLAGQVHFVISAVEVAKKQKTTTKKVAKKETK